MKIKETRGRKKKYEFNLKVGQVVSMPFSNGARTSALAYARKNGLRFRTWREGDVLKIGRPKPE